MLQTIREYLAERVDRREDGDEVRRRHAEHFRRMGEHADAGLRGVDQRWWTDRLEFESGNLGAAIRWYLAHDTAPLPHLLRALFPFWELRDHLGETHVWIDQILPQAESMPVQSRAELYWIATMAAAEAGDDEARMAAHRRLEPLIDGIEEPLL